jgi:sugar lactone lactonase YvrE
MKNTLLIASFCVCAISALRADGTIQTLMGVDVPDGVSSIGAAIGDPRGLVVDPVGNVYFSDDRTHRVRRIDGSTHILTTVAGSGKAGFSGDGGPAAQAELNGPQGLAYVNQDNHGQEVLFVSDTNNQRIREIDLSTGIITTVAGNGTLGSGASGDGGPAVLASLDNPGGIVANASDQVWFVDGGSRVRTFVSGIGNISTVAGNGSGSYSGDGGAATSAGLGSALSLAVGPDGNLYIGCGLRVREVSPATGGGITTVAGTGSNLGPIGDGGPALSAVVGQVYGITTDLSDNLYFTADGGLLREVDAATHHITSVAGTQGNIGYYFGDGGPALSAGLAGPTALHFSGNGDLFLIDGQAIRKIDATTQFISGYGGLSTVVSGTASVAANQFSLGYPVGPVTAPTPGDLFVGDGNRNGQVFLYHGATGMLSLYAGTGQSGTSGDGGPALNATFQFIDAMASDASGNLYLADDFNDLNALRRIDGATHNITLVANVNQSDNYGGDGHQGLDPAVTLGHTGGLACAPGWLYLSDKEFNTIRRINTATTVINLVAGPGVSGSAGFVDGPLASARFNTPLGLAADAAGNIYVADNGNNAVRKVDMTALAVTTLAGLGPNQPGYRGDGGLAVNAGLNGPTAVWLDPVGNVFVADTNNQRIRKIDPITGLISTVAGNGLQGFGGDGGAALMAQLNGPLTGMVDAVGNLFVDDLQNFRIREVTYYHTPTPTPVSPGYSKPVAYPSPANDHICFSYYSKGPGHVSIQVYNLGLQLAARFDDNVTGAGAQVSCGDTSRFATGAYIYRLTLPDGSTDAGKFKVIH